MVFASEVVLEIFLVRQHAAVVDGLFVLPAVFLEVQVGDEAVSGSMAVARSAVVPVCVHVVITW